MKKVFCAGDGFKVPDGTIVHSIIDPRIASQYKSEWVDELSIALGRIPPKTTSKIHAHPLVTQVTLVLSGGLTVKMKDGKADKPYAIDLAKEQSAVTRPGTFFQLINSGDEECRVLYIVSPAFIFECDERGNVIYNDAIVLDEDWIELSGMNWMIPQMKGMDAAVALRNESKRRLRAACQNA
jgi:mannose-6-phosphate isomerase-like protein (cupin superfamily)